MKGEWVVLLYTGGGKTTLSCEYSEAMVGLLGEFGEAAYVMGSLGTLGKIMAQSKDSCEMLEQRAHDSS